MLEATEKRVATTEMKEETNQLVPMPETTLGMNQGRTTRVARMEETTWKERVGLWAASACTTAYWRPRILYSATICMLRSVT